jgi:hypothetical protein
MRKARDGNGVAADAEGAVDAANGSSGTALPSSVRSKFESSLGTDLSGVRVHTGGASETAAGAVGARAYTIGQNIHFGAGYYDPSSRDGQHLLAHEVAHTVQQRGASPHRQNKLEVSSPHDAAEHEADRAADAMVTGAPVALGHTGGAQIHRDYRTDLDKAGDAGEEAAKHGGNDKVMQIKTIKDKNEAQAAHKVISGWTTELTEALTSKDAAPLHVQKNNHALGDLEAFMGATEAQDLGLANFKVLYKNVQVQYARLEAMAQTTGAGLTDKNQEKGVSAASGKDLAKDHIDNAARNNKGTSAVAERAKKIASVPGNEEIAAKLKALQEESKPGKDPLEPQINEVTRAQSASTNSVNKIKGAAAKISALDASFKSSELKSQYAAAKAKVDETNKTVEETLGLVLDVTKSAVSEGPAGAAKTLAEKLGPKCAVMIAAAAGVPGLTMSASDEAKDKEGDVEADKAKMKEYEAARSQFKTSTQDAQNTFTGFLNAVALLEQKKQERKAKLDELGAALDAAETKMTGKKTKEGETGTFRTITTFLAEADNFIASAKAAKGVGEGDLSRSKSGSAASEASIAQSHVKSVSVYIADAWQVQPKEGPKRFNISYQSIPLEFDGKDSAFDSGWDKNDGAISTISDAVHAIDKFIEEIEAYRKEMRASLGV